MSLDTMVFGALTARSLEMPHVGFREASRRTPREVEI
jgi:hypothetical protein